MPATSRTRPASPSKPSKPSSLARSEPAWLIEQRREAGRRSAKWTGRSATTKSGFAPTSACSSSNQFRAARSTRNRRARKPTPAAADRRRGSRRPDDCRSTAGRTARGSKRSGQTRASLFGSLDELVNTHGDLVRKHLFSRAVDPSYDKFAALHAACWSGGHLLYVPRGVVDRRAAALLVGARQTAARDLGHTLVVLEDGAEATLMCETASHVARRAGGLHCGATEVDPRAQLAAAARQPAELGAAASGTSPIRRRSSAATRRCNGRSPPSAAGCRR